MYFNILTLYLFVINLDAYSRAHLVNEAESLLGYMIAQYENGEYRVKPDGFTFNAV